MDKAIQDRTVEIVNRVFDTDCHEINKLKSIDKQLFIDLAAKLAGCEGVVHTTGCGTSGMAAQKVAHSLCCVEISASYLVPSDAVHGGLGRLREGDIIIFFSKGGNTNELVRMLHACKRKGLFIVTVGEDAKSVLAHNADIYVPVKVDQEPCRFNLLATASTLAMIAVFDAVCILLMYRKEYSRKAFLLIHPGGAVGEKLANSQ
jgi:D-arabinose 5-phosphate isomerase GutQ